MLFLLVQRPYSKHPRLEEGRVEGYVCTPEGPKQGDTAGQEGR